jgi:hypothetical protein
VLDRAVDGLLHALDDAGSLELRDFLSAIKQDQGAVLQLTPESMDLFQAGVEDRAGVAYQSTVSMAPLSPVRKWLAQVLHPWNAASMSIFTALHSITGRADRRYPCAELRPPVEGRPAEAWAGERTEAVLRAAFGREVTVPDNDGVVPLRSQLWGTVVWAGLADHLDVLGHFHGGEDDAVPSALRHRDWLVSGSGFDQARFDALMDAIASGMLVSARAEDVVGLA